MITPPSASTPQMLFGGYGAYRAARRHAYCRTGLQPHRTEPVTMHSRLLQRRLDNALATLSVSLTLLEREVAAPRGPRPPTRVPRPPGRRRVARLERPRPCIAAA